MHFQGGESYGQQNPENSYQLKFITVGDSSVGKSSIMLRFSQNSFNPNLHTTIVVEYLQKHLIYNNTDYLIQIFDTAGQEKYQSVTRTYYKSSAVALLVYDITNEDSFRNIQIWLENCKNFGPRTILLVLIGNKSDLEDKRVVTKERGEEFANENDMIFFETSAFSGNGVQEAFQNIIEIMDKKIKSGFYDLRDSVDIGVKKIKMSNNNAGEIKIDKAALTEGNKKKKKKFC